MSADWFCKIGEKKIGPLNGQQLKTVVAKGQLKPEHLVRRGSEGPWVPAGRIKGLFPEGPAGNAQGQRPSQATGKALPKAAAKAGTPPKAAGLPTAAEAPAPPAADIPQELRLGGHHKHHAEMNIDSLHIEATPVDVSRRKLRSGMQGLKKAEQKKLTVLLLCFIGGGTAIGLIVIIWAFATGKFSSPEPKKADLPAALAQAADSSKKGGKDSAEKKPTQGKDKDKGKDSEPDSWQKLRLPLVVGDVEATVLKATRGAPPKGAKTNETEVLVVQVKLNLKEGATKDVELKNWTDESFHYKLSLKDDQNKGYDLLDQVPADKASDSKTITKRWMKLDLVFEAPPDKKLKFLHLKLPSAAFQADGPVLGFEINASDIRTEEAKPEKADKASKADEDDKK